MINIDNSKFDLFLHKCFDIKLKEGHTMSTAVIDEKNYLTTLYFLKNTRIYQIDIPSKQLEELSFSKNHEVFYITGNSNNEYLIAVFKNGKIFAVGIKKQIFYFKNLQNQDKDNNNNNKVDNSFKIFCNDNLDKVVVYTSAQITVWYRSLTKTKITSSKEITELMGFHIYIQLKEERKVFLSQKDKLYKDDFICYFGNNYYLGSFIRLFYILLIPQTELKNTYKLMIINYLFIFDKENKLKAIDNPDVQINEYKTKFNSKYIYSYILSDRPIENDKTKSQRSTRRAPPKKTIISKSNTSGTMIAIALNFPNEQCSQLILFATEVYKFSSYNLANIVLNKDDEDDFLTVEDLEWLCNDIYIIIFFAGGYFTIMNTSFQTILFYDFSNNITKIENTNLLYAPIMLIQSTNDLSSQKIKLIASKQKTDYFVIYVKNIILGFQCSNQSFIDRRINNEISSFEDFLADLTFYQVNYIEDENQKDILFDKLNNFIVMTFNDIFLRGDNDNLFQSENVNSLIKSFVKFILIFRNLNLIHETNLPILSYFLNVSNDFFFYLIKLKEIWLAFLFIELFERYMLKIFRLKNVKSKKNIQNQQAKFIKETANILFNPYGISNISLKCYNKINNNTIQSKWRMILLIYSLIEFRSNQALNINVLYFILGKIITEKLQKNNLLDDIHLILKIIIRNWKYLKNENLKAGGEEYVLNGLTMNHRTELMSQFLHTKINKNDNFNIDFLNEFFSVDELYNFLYINKIFCIGNDEALINEYSYVNNIGVIQKWILFFGNNLYSELFEDLKDYLNNHLKQIVDNIMKKNEDNISPDEINLGRIVYFNLFFFLLSLANLFKSLLKSFSKKSLNNKKLYKLVSPIDIPFILYEFYSESNNIQDQDGLEKLLLSYFQRYQKHFTFTISDSFDLADYLMGKGFKFYSDNMDEINENNDMFEKSPIQNYIYSMHLFYLMIIHKTNSVFLFENCDKIIDSIDLLDKHLKKDILEFYLLILNGYVKYFLYKEEKNKLKNKKVYKINFLAEKNLFLNKNFIILSLIRKIFYKILTDQNYLIRRDICDFITLTEDFMKFPFIESALFVEYKNLKNLGYNSLFEANNILDISVLNKNLKVQNLFEVICSNTCSNTIFETIFGNDALKKEKISLSIKNIANLLFNIDKDSNFTYELSQNKIATIFQFNSNDTNIVDQIITGDINNYKFFFNESNYPLNILANLKLSIIKIIHFMNILYVKYKILTINPIQDTLNYIKLLSFCLIFEKKENNFIKHVNQLICFVNITIEKDIFLQNDTIQKKIFDIIVFIEIGYITHGIKENENMINLESKLKNRNSKLFSNFTSYKKSILLPINKYINKAEPSTSKKLRNIIINLNNPFYLKITVVVLNQLKVFANLLFSGNKNRAFKFVIEKYNILNENFSNLTGINPKSFIEFTEYWDLIHCHPISEMITKKETEVKTKIIKEQFELLLTERQKSKNKLPSIPNKQLNFINFFLSDKKANDVNIDELKEKEIDIQPSFSPIIHLKIKQHSDIEDEDISVSINQSIVYNPPPINRIPHKKKSPIERFLIKIKKIFFHEFLTQIFQNYKKRISGQELEEIKIIQVNPKEGNYKISNLREKYVSTRDLIKAQRKEKNYLSSLKHFDIINVNKYQQGNSENSKIFQELISSKKTKKITETIKEKLLEYNQKIKHYEFIVKTLGKEFNSQKGK